MILVMHVPVRESERMVNHTTKNIFMRKLVIYRISRH